MSQRHPCLASKHPIYDYVHDFSSNPKVAYRHPAESEPQALRHNELKHLYLCEDFSLTHSAVPQRLPLGQQMGRGLPKLWGEDPDFQQSNPGVHPQNENAMVTEEAGHSGKTGYFPS